MSHPGDSQNGTLGWPPCSIPVRLIPGPTGCGISGAQLENGTPGSSQLLVYWYRTWFTPAYRAVPGLPRKTDELSMPSTCARCASGCPRVPGAVPGGMQGAVHVVRTCRTLTTKYCSWPQYPIWRQVNSKFTDTPHPISVIRQRGTKSNGCRSLLLVLLAVIGVMAVIGVNWD